MVSLDVYSETSTYGHNLFRRSVHWPKLDTRRGILCVCTFGSSTRLDMHRWWHPLLRTHRWQKPLPHMCESVFTSGFASDATWNIRETRHMQVKVPLYCQSRFHCIANPGPNCPGGCCNTLALSIAVHRAKALGTFSSPCVLSEWKHNRPSVTSGEGSLGLC